MLTIQTPDLTHQPVCEILKAMPRIRILAKSCSRDLIS